MLIEETFSVNAPVEEVWNLLVEEPDALQACVPGCEKIEALAPGTFRAVIKVKVGFISGTFDVNTVFTRVEPPVCLQSTSKGKDNGLASLFQSNNVLRLEALAEGATRVHCQADISMFGRLAPLGQGIARAKAKQIAQEFARRLQLRMEG